LASEASIGQSEQRRWRRLAKRSHDRQHQLAISSGGLNAVIARTAKEDCVDLIFRRLGEAVGQLAAVREPGPEPFQHAILDMPLVFRGGDRCVAACRDGRGAGLNNLEALVLFTPRFVHQLHDRILKECRRAGCPARDDLPLDHALKLVG
jgi:hypothetical protein